MIAPYYISENNSDIRGIKAGWYAIDNDGKLVSGPFSSREKCVEGKHSFNEPTNAVSAALITTDLPRTPLSATDGRSGQRPKVQPEPPAKDACHERKYKGKDSPPRHRSD